MKFFKDLREHYLGLLLEDRIDFLKQQYKDKLDTSHDTLAKHQDSDKIIDHFAKRGDPSAGKAYTQWLINQYKNKSIRQEDARAIKNTLADFEKVKGKLEKKDINQYADPAELRDAVATQKGAVERETKAKKKSEEEKSTGLQDLYSEDGVTGHKIPNRNASINLYGPGGKICKTNWCTAANSSNNMFNHYKGGKYTMHFPNGEVLQFHHQSGQIMDKNDRPIDESDPRFSPYAKHIDNFLRQTEKLEDGRQGLMHKFRTITPEEVEHHISSHEKYKTENPHAYYNPHDDNVTAVAEAGQINDDQFGRLMNIADSSEGWRMKGNIRGGLQKNSNATENQLKQMIDKVGPDEYLTDAKAMGNPALKGEPLNTLIDHHIKEGNGYPLNRIAGNNPNLTKEQIEKIEQSGDSDVHQHILANKSIKLDKDQQEHYLKKLRSKGESSTALTERSDVHPDTVNNVIGDNKTKENELGSIIRSPHLDLNKEQVDKIRQHPSFTGHNAKDMFLSGHSGVDENARDGLVDKMVENGGLTPDVVRSKNFTEGHVGKVLNSTDVAHKAILAGSPRVNSEQLHGLLDTLGKESHSQILTNRKAKPEHLKRVIDQNPSESRMYDVLEHPSVNGDVLHHILDKGNDLYKGAALHHPATQPSHFTRSLESGIKMHGPLSSAPGTPPSVLDKLADSPLSYVRQNVAQHKNTQNETLGKLRSDSNPEVSAIASKRYKG